MSGICNTNQRTSGMPHQEPSQLDTSRSMACFPVRLITAAKLPGGRWFEDFWRDVVLPMPPFVGMQLNLDNEDDIRTIASIQWVEENGRLMADLGTDDYTGTELPISEDDWLQAGWKKEGLWK